MNLPSIILRKICWTNDFPWGKIRSWANKIVSPVGQHDAPVPTLSGWPTPSGVTVEGAFPFQDRFPEAAAQNTGLLGLYSSLPGQDDREARGCSESRARVGVGCLPPNSLDDRWVRRKNANGPKATDRPTGVSSQSEGAKGSARTLLGGSVPAAPSLPPSVPQPVPSKGTPKERIFSYQGTNAVCCAAFFFPGANFSKVFSE